MKLTYSAPAKVIISGEHSVVYSQNAICAAINLRIYVTIEQVLNHTPGIILEDDFVESSNITINNPNKQIRALAIILQSLNQENIQECFQITSNNQIPLNSGLGSSASYAVALSKCLTHAIMKKEPKDIVELAKQVENIFHGQTGSGLDVTIVSQGGLLQYKKPNLMKQLTCDDTFKKLKFLIINSGVDKIGGTQKAVEQVGQYVKQNGMDVINKMGEITNEIIGMMNQFDYQRFKQLIRMNQMCLKEISISVKECDEIVQICQKYGVESKITGAGNGGCCIGFVMDEQIDEMVKELEQKSYKCWFSEIVE